MENTKINILGTEYTIKIGTPKEYERLETCDGYTNPTAKLIVISDTSKAQSNTSEKENSQNYQKDTLRHEIIHAFLHESGLAWCSSSNLGAWAVNEEMVDWFAIQSPKIFKTFQELDIL
jgi:hypothetical protein